MTAHPALRRFAYCCAAGLLSATASAQSPAFPSWPVRIVMPFTAGGSTDLLARVLGQKLTERWGQQTIVENRPGAATIVASEFVAKAPPDGHTLLFVTTAFAVNPGLYPKLPYDTLKDFAPVILISTSANTLVAHPALPVTGMADLIRLAKTRPGALAYASAGSGTAAHVSVELLQSMAGIKLEHIPYKGIPQASVDVMSGQVPLMITSLPNALPYARSGKLKALGITTRTRSAIAPDIPAIAESVPGYDAATWQGIVTGAGVPRPVVDRLYAEIAAILQMPDVREKLTADGSEFVGAAPDRFGTQLRAEIEKWAKVIKASGARPD